MRDEFIKAKEEEKDYLSDKYYDLLRKYYDNNITGVLNEKLPYNYWEKLA